MIFNMKVFNIYINSTYRYTTFELGQVSRILTVTGDPQKAD